MLYLMIILIALCLSFIFSGSEMGLYSVNRLRLRSRAEIHRPGARMLRELVRKPQRAINTILIGNNLAHYVATVCCAALLAARGVTRGTDLYSTIILAPLLVVFTEIMPKMLFLERADILMYKIGPWLRVAQVVFMPFLQLLKGVNSLFCLLTGKAQSELEYHFTPEKLRSLLSHGAEAGLVSRYQHGMLENVLRVKNIPLSQAYIHLDQVVMAPATASRAGILKILRGNDYSRIPVYSGGRENITGLINLIDMFEVETDEDVGHALREPVYVNTDDSVSHALYRLQRSGQQMAVVLDAGGDAAGICTVKDLVEEIVGELYDW